MSMSSMMSQMRLENDRQRFYQRGMENDALKEKKRLEELARRKEDLNYSRKLHEDFVNRIYGEADKKDERKQELDKQSLVNRGLMDQGQLEQAGLDRRLNVTEAGEDRRQGREFEFQKSMPVFKEFKNRTDSVEDGEKETSEWKNVNTAAGRLHGDPGGGAWEDSDMESLTGPSKNRTPRTESSESEYQKRLAEMQGFGDTPTGTGTITRLSDGSVFGANTPDVPSRKMSTPEALPTRVHDLSQTPTMAQSAPPVPSQPVFPRTLESRNTLIGGQSPPGAPGVSTSRPIQRKALGLNAENRFGGHISRLMDTGEKAALEQEKNKYPFRRLLETRRY